MGLGTAFTFGLFMDVHDGALMGQHALAYTLLTFLAIAVHRRLLWFMVLLQAVQVVPLFFIAHFASAVIRLIVGGTFPGWELAAAPAVEAALWPFATWILLAPQRRPPDPDRNRPL